MVFRPDLSRRFGLRILPTSRCLAFALLLIDPRLDLTLSLQPAPQQSTAVNARLDVTVLSSTRPTDYAISFGPVSGPSVVGSKKSLSDAALQGAISSEVGAPSSDVAVPARRAHGSLR